MAKRQDPQRNPLHPQRRGCRAAARSRRTRRCSTICGSAVRCAAPRKAAPKAIAAPAPCWSAGSRTASWSMKASMPASASSARSTARHVVTVEHLRGDGRRLHPVQQAMVDFHGSQCGFCTPGFVMSLYALWMTRRRSRRTPQIEKALQGNLCRCTGYEAIVRAARAISSYGKAAKDPLAAERKAITAKLAAMHDGSARRDRRAARRGWSCRPTSMIWPALLDAEPRRHDRRRLDRCRPVGDQVHARHFAG